MAKSIKESYGPVQYHNSQTMLEKESRNCGDNCQCDPLNSEDEPYCNCVAEGKSDERRAKIARAAKAGAENKAKEKAKATEKHNQNSAKSRAGVDYLKKGGNKDQFGRVRKEEFEITESDKAEYDKLMKQYGDMPASKIPPKTYMRISQLGRKVRGDKGGPKVGDLLKSMKKKKMGEEVGLSGKAARDDEKEERKANKIVSAMRLKKIKQDQSKDKASRDSIQKLAKTDARYRSRKANEEVDQVGEESIKINGGSAVEIGKNERGSKTEYYWKDKSGLILLRSCDIRYGTMPTLVEQKKQSNSFSVKPRQDLLHGGVLKKRENLNLISAPE